MSSAFRLEGTSNVWSVSEQDRNKGSNNNDLISKECDSVLVYLTFEICEMMLLQECGMSEGSHRHSVSCQLVAHIGCSKAITDASIFCVRFSVAFLYSFHPLRYSYICKRCVLLFPCFVIKVRVRVIVAVLAVFPYWILPCLSADEISLELLAWLSCSHTPRK